MTDQLKNRGKFYTAISIVHSLALSLAHSLTQIIFLIQENREMIASGFLNRSGYEYKNACTTILASKFKKTLQHLDKTWRRVYDLCILLYLRVR